MTGDCSDAATSLQVEEADLEWRHWHAHDHHCQEEEAVNHWTRHHLAPDES